MGWNSWDCYGPTVQESEVKANADYMAKYLKQYGWQYIVVDIRWYVENDKAGGYNQTNPRYVMDAYGRYLPATNRFPSAAGGKGFKSLADYVHAKGLKFGIHIMRGIPKVAVEKNLPIKNSTFTADSIYSPDMQCEWLKDNYTVRNNAGGQAYYNSLFDLYASWGVDFVKVDDLSRPYRKEEIEMIRKAIDHCGRRIVLSMSPGATPVSEAQHAATHANMWRMVDDVWDNWSDVTHVMEVAGKWYPFIASGTYPDCDMLPLGRIAIRGERGAERMTRLTKEEQYSLMSFFSIFRSPLMFGGDLPSNDSFTLSLLTNKDVLQMHREAIGVRQLFRKDSTLAVTAHLPNGKTIYLALFNIKDKGDAAIAVSLKDIDIDSECEITDMWSGGNLGKFSGSFAQNLVPHACGLYKIIKL